MEKIRIGIVGLNFGRHIIENEILQGSGSPFFRLAAVCDMNLPKAKEFGAKNAVPAYGNLDELLSDDSIKAIGLFTGPNGRAQLLKRIIRAGRDVMTTKPFELDANEAMKVLEEAERLGRTIHLNSPSPKPSPELEQIQEWRESMNLGRPVLMRWETYAPYNEKADGSWYDDPEKCPVAPIFRLGIYGINDLVSICGEPESVQVMHSRIRTGRPTPDNASLTVRFKNGAIGNILASFCIEDGRCYSNNLDVRFEHGSIERTTIWPSRDCELRLYLKDGKGIPERTAAFKGAESSGSYNWKSFANSISGNGCPIHPDKSAIVAGIRTINAMGKAEKSGRTIAIDNNKE